MAQGKILIFIPVGDSCEALAWIHNLINIESYLINFLLVYYGKQVTFSETFTDKRVKVIYDQSPSKFEKFYKYTKTGEINLESYDLFWIADDDIKISVKSAINFFESFKRLNLDIAQPGCLGFAMGKQLVRRNQKYSIRFTNYVDGIAPLFSKDALVLCLETFENCQSGRGIDHVWASLLGNPKNKIAVIDSALMYHMNPSGANYARFDQSIDAQYAKIQDRYLKQVNQYYKWDQRIVHGSIPSDQIKFISLFNPIVNRICEIKELGFMRLSRYQFAKMKSHFRKWR